MARQDRSADPAEIQLAIEAAIQDFVGRGLVADSGQRRWSERKHRSEKRGYGTTSTQDSQRYS